MKRFYRQTWFWIAGAALVAAGAGAAVLGFLNPMMFAETAPEHAEPALRTRRYPVKGDLPAMRRTVEEIVPTLHTWGAQWRLTPRKDGDSAVNLEIVRAEIPVTVFMDDIRIELRREGETVIVNARSESRIGGEGTDFGEIRRHLRQILAALDKAFGANQ